MKRVLLPAVLLLVLVGVIPTPRTARANGVPIRIPLSYLSGLSNWGPADARGEAEVSYSEALIRIDARGLPALRNEIYQAWLVKSGANKATSAGTFTVAADGVAGFSGKLGNLDGYDYDLVIITVEPSPDNDPAPSAQRSIGGFFAPVKKPESAPAIAGDTQPATLPTTGEVMPPAPAARRHMIAVVLFCISGLSLAMTLRRRPSR